MEKHEMHTSQARQAVPLPWLSSRTRLEALIGTYMATDRTRFLLFRCETVRESEHARAFQAGRPASSNCNVTDKRRLA